MITFTSGIAGEDIEDGEVVAGLTADGLLYAKPPTDGTGPIINTHEYGKPMSGEMVYYPRPDHPLEEENQRLKEENERLARWVASQCKTMDALREEIATLRKRHGYREEK